MSIQDQLKIDAEKESLKEKSYIQTCRDKLFSLKGRKGLFDDGDFIWFFKKYIQKPYVDCSKTQESCLETNKTFVLKGEKKALKSIMQARADLYAEIEELQNTVKKFDLDEREEKEDLKPRN